MLLSLGVLCFASGRVLCFCSHACPVMLRPVLSPAQQLPNANRLPPPPPYLPTSPTSSTSLRLQWLARQSGCWNVGKGKHVWAGGIREAAPFA